MRYVGLSNPGRAFEELKPYRDKLIAMSRAYRPFGPEYLALLAAQKALDAAALHLTGDPMFFTMKPSQSKGDGSP